jgi:hypothetical protein
MTDKQQPFIPLHRCRKRDVRGTNARTYLCELNRSMDEICATLDN